MQIKTQKQIKTLQTKAQKAAEQLNQEVVVVAQGKQHIQVQVGKAYQLSIKDVQDTNLVAKKVDDDLEVTLGDSVVVFDDYFEVCATDLSCLVSLPVEDGGLYHVVSDTFFTLEDGTQVVYFYGEQSIISTESSAVGGSTSQGFFEVAGSLSAGSMVALTVVAGVALGGGGGGDTTTATTLTGFGSAGKFVGGLGVEHTIEVFKADGSGESLGTSALAADGSYSVTITGYTGAVYVQLHGGAITHKDEASTSTAMEQLNTDFFAIAVVSAGSNTAHINAQTTIATQVAIKQAGDTQSIAETAAIESTSATKINLTVAQIEAANKLTKEALALEGDILTTRIDTINSTDDESDSASAIAGFVAAAISGYGQDSSALGSLDIIISAAIDAISNSIANTGGLDETVVDNFLKGLDKVIAALEVYKVGGATDIDYSKALEALAKAKTYFKDKFSASQSPITKAGFKITDDTGINDNFITSDDSVTIGATLGTALSGDQKLWGSVDGGEKWENIIVSSGVTAVSWSKDLTEEVTSSIQFVITKTATATATTAEIMADKVGGIATHEYTFDKTAPTLSSTAPSIALTGGGDSIGDTIQLTLTFDGDVKGLTSGTDDTIFADVHSGGTATWSGVDGTNTRVLTYTIMAGDNDKRPGIDEAKLKVVLEAGITDTAGNVFSYSGAISDIDTTTLPRIDGIQPIAAPIITGLEEANGTAIDTDYSTNKNTGVTIKGTYTGTIAEGETLKISLDGGKTWVTATTATGGNWTLTDQTITTNTIQAGVFNAQNNHNTTLATKAVTVDITPPGKPIITIKEDEDAYVNSDEDNITLVISITEVENGNTVTIKLQQGDTTVGSDYSKVVIDGKVEVTVLKENLNSGNNLITATVEDAAGNHNSIASNTITIKLDTNAPNAALITKTSVANDSNVEVQSSEVGVAYLVLKTVANTSTNIDTVVRLDALAKTNEANKVKINTANQDTSLATTDLKAGEYVLVSVDSAGNVSGATTDIVAITDGTSPTIESASINSDTKTLILTLSESVTGSPENSDFIVKSGASGSESDNAITKVEVSDNEVILTLTTAVAQEHSVSVSYAANSDNTKKLKDGAGNAVVNDVEIITTVVDKTPSIINSATIDSGTKLLVLTLSEAVTGLPENSDFVVKNDTNASPTTGNTVISVAVFGKKVVLTLTNEVQDDHYITIAYTSNSDDTKKLKDGAGNVIATDGETTATIVDITPPSAVDLDSTTDGAQSAHSTAINKLELSSGVAFAADIATATTTDISKIKVVLGGTQTGDKLVLDTDKEVSNDFNAKDKTIGTIGGLKYDYTVSDNTLIVQKVNGSAISAADVAKIVKAIKLKNDETTPAENDRTAKFSYKDEMGNESISAIATIIVDVNPATIIAFDSTTDDGHYKKDTVISITATASEVVQADGKITVTLNSGGTAILTADGTTTLTGAYTVGASQNSADLKVSSFTLGVGVNTPKDTAGNPMTATNIPSNNISGIVIDTTAPSQPTLDLSATDDTGKFDTDGITNKTSGLTITGAAEVGATIQLYKDGIAISNATAIVNNTGVFSIDIDLANSATSHNITAKATDAAGNTSSASSPSLSITVDTTDPVFNSGETGTGVVGQTIAYNANADNDNNIIYTLRTADLVKFNINVTTGVVTYKTPPTSITNTPDNIAITATDIAGNFKTQNVAVSVAEAPIIESIISSVTGDIKGGVGIVFTLTMSEGISISNGTPTITFEVDGEEFTATHASASGKTITLNSVNIPTTGDGAVTVKSIDLNGATTEGALSGQPWQTTATGQTVSNLTIDNTTPTVTSVAITATDHLDNEKTATLIVGDKIIVSVTMNEIVTLSTTLSDSATYAIGVGSANKIASYISGSGSNILKFAYTVVDADVDDAGGITATTTALALKAGVTLQDGVGHNATLATTAVATNANSITVDATAPTAVVNAISGLFKADGTTADTGTSSTDFVTKESLNITIKGTYTGTIESGETLKIYNGTTWVDATTATGGKWTLTGQTLTSHTIQAAVFDTAGNKSTPATQAVIVDTDALSAVDLNVSTSARNILLSTNDLSAGVAFVANGMPTPTETDIKIIKMVLIDRQAKDRKSVV